MLLTSATAVVYLLTADHAPIGSTSRYYEAAREMRELGDWLVPHLGYAPYAEKPPLVYWLGAAARTLGDGPLATSLPSAIAGAVTIVCTALLGRATRSAAVGLGAALLLLGTAFAQAMLGVLITDTLVSAAAAAAFWTFYEWERSGRARMRWLVAFYIAIALGWLAKGPIALAVPAAGIALYALFAGGVAGVGVLLLAMRPLLGVLVIALIDGPWTLAWWLRDPRLVEFFYLRINLGSFFGDPYNHEHPVWFYGPTLLGALAPFTIVALPVWIAELVRALRGVRLRSAGWRADPPADPASLYLACCAIGPFLLLSASVAKLGTYLMPLMPPVFVLVAIGIARWSATPRWVKVAMALQSGALAIAVGWVFFGGAASHVAALDEDAAVLRNPTAQATAVAALVFQLGAFVAIARNRLRVGLALLGVGVAVCLAILAPRVDALVPDDIDLVRALRAHGGDDAALPEDRRDLVLLHTSAEKAYLVPFALGRRFGIVGHAREVGLGLFLQAHPDASVPMPGPDQPISHPYQVSGDNTEHPWLWSRARLVETWNGPRRVWLILHGDEIPNFEASGLVLHRVAHVRSLWLVSNRPG